MQILGRLPLWALHGLATLLFVVAYYVVRWRRSLTESNLANAFPELTQQQRRGLARAHLRTLIDTTMEAIKGISIAPDELRRRVIFRNAEILDTFADQPIFLASAHQGNWEWQLLALSERLELPIEAIYAPSPSATLEKTLTQTRSRFGINLISRDNTMVEIAKRLKTPRLIAILADQNPRRDVERIWLNFLHQDTAFPAGLEKLARLTRYPIVFQESRRIKRGYYEVTFRVLCEPPYAKEGHEIMTAYAQALETSIQQSPEDWLWSYDRWRYPKPLYG